MANELMVEKYQQGWTRIKVLDSRVNLTVSPRGLIYISRAVWPKELPGVRAALKLAEKIAKERQSG